MLDRAVSEREKERDRDNNLKRRIKIVCIKILWINFTFFQAIPLMSSLTTFSGEIPLISFFENLFLLLFLFLSISWVQKGK